MIGSYTEGDEPVPGFRLIGMLGWGQFGQVWKAAGPGGTEVALKIVDLTAAETLKEFRNIRRVRQIRHPNLVSLVAYWLKDRQGSLLDEEILDDTESASTQAVELIIAMGLGEKTLVDRLQECRQQGHAGIPPEELLNYITDVARALDHLNQPIHDLGDGPVAMQHCDIKPQNILLMSGAAQVCDLGVVRIVGDTRRTTAMGSAAYISPEILQHGHPSVATDQYSLAITYCELRTGQLPINVNSAARAFLAHLRGRLDFSRVPEPEREVLLRATSLEPEQRYTSCMALVAALRVACTGATCVPLSVAPVDTTAATAAVVDATEAEEPLPTRRPASQADRPTIRVPRAEQASRKTQVPLSEDDFPVPQPVLKPLCQTGHACHPHAVAPRTAPALPRTATAAPRTAPALLPQVPPRPPTPPAAPVPLSRPPGPPPAAKVPAWRHITLRLALPPALCAGVMIGTLSAWLARHSEPVAVDAAAPPVAVSSVVETPATPAPLRPIRIPDLPRGQSHPFEILERSQTCNTLGEALSAAHDGDTILLHGHGPFVTGPLEIRGKSLTLRAAPGSRPVLVRAPSGTPTPWQALLATDRALTVEGIELRDDRAGVSVAAGEAAYLLVSEQAPLQLINCRLLAPRGVAAVVCRHPGRVELRDCWVVVDQLALCVEVAEGLPCELTLVGNSIRTEAPGGAALSLWSAAGARRGAVKVVLERNTLAAGRLAAWKALTRGVSVEARDNDFLFREALFSYVGFPGVNGWQRATTWHGRDNRYHGPPEWVHVEGRPVGVTGLPEWRRTFKNTETGSISSDGVSLHPLSVPVVDGGGPS